MKIYKTKTNGFCFGVKRAVEQTFDILKNRQLPVYLIGELIHNDKITEQLISLGAVIVESADSIPDNSIAVIRAHGVSAAVEESLKARNISFYDMTCPKVKNIHRIASQSDNLIIVGNPEHPETIGIAGHAKNNYVFAESFEDIKTLVSDPAFSGIGTDLVFQTTFIVSEFRRIKEFIADFPYITIHNTICNSTEIRQKEVEELSRNVDLFIIIGSPKSSNTRKLYEIASRNCKAVFYEQLDSLPNGIHIYEKIGLASGASCPESAVEEVFNNMNNENDNKNPMVEEDVNFLEAVEASIRTIRNGQRVQGVVTAINGTEVQVDLGLKYAGFIPAAEFENDETPLKIGDEIEAFVVKVNDADGTALLSKRSLDIAQGMDKIIKANEEGAVVRGKVVEAVKGGVVVLVNKIRVFVPASQASLKREENFDALVGTEVNLRIIEVDNDKSGRRKRIIGSIKSVLREEKQKANEALWQSLAEGNEYQGVVKSVTDFGIFVDIGGADGLVHVTDMSWDRVSKPADLVKVGDTVKVKVKSLNPETKKISLTMKDENENPWKILTETYKVGDIIDVTVLKIMPYGAFVSVIKNIDGLVHISQIAPRRIAKVSDVLEVGQQVKAQITEINVEAKRVSLSIRAVEEANSDAPAAEEIVSDDVNIVSDETASENTSDAE
jgi:4-hydroxy-3-methylbut-2-enyl diphosphate reductase